MVATVIFEAIVIPDTSEKMFAAIGVVFVIGFIALIIWSAYQYFN